MDNIMQMTVPSFDFTAFISQTIEVLLSGLVIGVIGSVCVLIIVSAFTATQDKLK